MEKLRRAPKGSAPARRQGQGRGSACLLQAWDSGGGASWDAAEGIAHTSSATGPFKWATN